MGTDALDAAFALADSFVTQATKAASQQPVTVMGSGHGGSPTQGLGGGQSQAASREQERHYRGHQYTAIRPIATKIAEQPIRVGRIRTQAAAKDAKPNGAKIRKVPEGVRIDKATLPGFLKGIETLEVVPNHPLIKILERPNDVQVRWQLIYMTIACLELTGKAYWWMPLVNGQRQIWPIPPSWIYPNDSDTEFSATYTIHRPDTFTQDFTVPGKEVVFFNYPDPSNPFGATSPLQSLAMSVTASEHLEESQARAYLNGLFPSLAIMVGDVTNLDDQKAVPLLEQSQRDQIMDMLRRNLQGSGKYGSAVILDALIRDIKPITHKPAEMDFLDSGTQLQGRIEQGFGTNPIINGHVESANRASSTAAGEHFSEWTINPKIELLSQILTYRVAPMFGGPVDTLIWIEPFRVKDTERTRQEYVVAAQYGMCTVNEFRENVLGLHPVPWGDSCMWMSNKYIYVDMSGGEPKIIVNSGLKPDVVQGDTTGDENEPESDDDAAESEGDKPIDETGGGD